MVAGNFLLVWLFIATSACWINLYNFVNRGKWYILSSVWWWLVSEKDPKNMTEISKRCCSLLTLLSRTHLQTHWIGSFACSVNTFWFKRRLHVKWEKQLKLIVSHLHDEIARMITDASLEKMWYLLRPLFVWPHSAQYWGSNTWKNLGSAVQEWQSHMLSGCYASHFLFPLHFLFLSRIASEISNRSGSLLISSHKPISPWHSCWST